MVLMLGLASVANADEASLPSFIYRGYVEKADQGDPRASHALGVLHEKGLAPNSSIGSALEWYKKASELGHKPATSRLAEYYLANSQHYESVPYLRTLSESGDASAAYNLGIIYEYGLGVGKNLLMASEYYSDAIKLGHQDALVQLGAMHLRGDFEGATHDLGIEMMEKASSLGSSKAQKILQNIEK
ncbi:MAG: tetratricopeptide repeat protein [Alphaproteobacteria bacterium]|nr:tetratricopeptide repeat protein [Alphaproteobacteria bacterium]